MGWGVGGGGGGGGWVAKESVEVWRVLRAWREFAESLERVWREIDRVWRVGHGLAEVFACFAVAVTICVLLFASHGCLCRPRLSKNTRQPWQKRFRLLSCGCDTPFAARA